MERQPHFVEEFDLVQPTLVLVRSVGSEQTDWVALDETWSLIGSEVRFRAYVESETRVFLLSIKNRSKPCLLKHFKGAMEAGATLKELACIMALTFRESAGGDDCWTHAAWGMSRSCLPRTSSAARSRRKRRPKPRGALEPGGLEPITPDRD